MVTTFRTLSRQFGLHLGALFGASRPAASAGTHAAQLQESVEFEPVTTGTSRPAASAGTHAAQLHESVQLDPVTTAQGRMPPPSRQPAAAQASRAEPATHPQGSGAATDAGAEPAQSAAEIAPAARAAHDLFEIGIALGMPRDRAAAAACAAVRAGTGLDLTGMLQNSDRRAQAAQLQAAFASRAGSLPELPKVLAWLEGRDRASCAEILAGALGAEPDDFARGLRVGRVMAALGWRPYRPRSHGGRIVYRRPTMPCRGQASIRRGAGRTASMKE
jgi:hypothetical protein